MQRIKYFWLTLSKIPKHKLEEKGNKWLNLRLDLHPNPSLKEI
jgi:hypothetical protein